MVVPTLDELIDMTDEDRRRALHRLAAQRPDDDVVDDSDAWTREVLEEVVAEGA